MNLKNLKALLKDVLDTARQRNVIINSEEEIRIWNNPVSGGIHVLIKHSSGTLEYAAENGKLKRIDVWNTLIGE